MRPNQLSLWYIRCKVSLSILASIPPEMAKGPAEIAHGPIFIGFVIKTILYGLILLQAYLYYVTFKKDRLWLKLLVHSCAKHSAVNEQLTMLIDRISSSGGYRQYCIRCGVHIHCVNHPLQRPRLPRQRKLAICDGSSNKLQLFFAWRVKVLTGNIWLVSLITITSISSGLCAIGAAAATEWVPQFINFQKFEVVVIIWLAGSAVSDVVITAAMTWYLSGFGSSDQVIDRIIRLTIQTGFLQAVFAIIDLIFFLVDPSGTHLIFNWILSKLYSNAILSSLNSRSGWKFGSTDNGNLSAGISSTRRGQVVQVFRREEVELNVISDIKEDSYPSSERNSDPV